MTETFHIVEVLFPEGSRRPLGFFLCLDQNNICRGWYGITEHNTQVAFNATNLSRLKYEFNWIFDRSNHNNVMSFEVNLPQRSEIAISCIEFNPEKSYNYALSEKLKALQGGVKAFEGMIAQ